MAYTSYSLAALQTLLSQRYEGSAFWTPPEATNALNEALRTFNLLTGYWRQQTSLTTLANTYDYALPTSLLYRTRVAFNLQPLDLDSLTGLDRTRPSWMTETTATGSPVPSRPRIWMPVSLQTIRIWPADATGGSLLTVDGIAATPILTAPGDLLDLGDDLLNVLLGYALHALSFKRGEPWFSATFPLYKAFLVAAADQNSLIKTSQIFRRAMAQDSQRGVQPIIGAPTLLDAVAGVQREQGAA